MKRQRRSRDSVVRHVVRYYTDWWAVVGAIGLMIVLYFVVSFMAVGLFLIQLIGMGIVVDGFVVIGAILITSCVGAIGTVALVKAIMNDRHPEDYYMMKKKVEHRGL